jgi:hypothetical protein
LFYVPTLNTGLMIHFPSLCRHPYPYSSMKFCVFPFILLLPNFSCRCNTFILYYHIYSLKREYLILILGVMWKTNQFNENLCVCKVYIFLICFTLYYSWIFKWHNVNKLSFQMRKSGRNSSNRSIKYVWYIKHDSE